MPNFAEICPFSHFADFENRSRKPSLGPVPDTTIGSRLRQYKMFGPRGFLAKEL